MEKLELKHLAPYLPYKVKMLLENSSPFELISDEVSACIEYGAKPILRNLSYLTKQIEHNGEKFVPIRLLAQIGTGQERCFVTNSNYRQCFVESDEYKNGFFIYHPDRYFIWQVGKNSEMITVDNQYELFQKLFEWHFDIFGLIDRNLAIDINSIEK